MFDFGSGRNHVKLTGGNHVNAGDQRDCREMRDILKEKGLCKGQTIESLLSDLEINPASAVCEALDGTSGGNGKPNGSGIPN
jgi:hypothetical protein